jgi:hypothetical protein
MMLGEPRDRVAELVGEPRLLGDFAEHLGRRLVRLARPHQIEDAEFHASCSTLLRHEPLAERDTPRKRSRLQA